MAVIAFKPKRGYSFTAHAAANPSTPPPGDRIDGEIDRLDRTIVALAGQLERVLNPDGSLKPGVVGKTNLKPGIFDEAGTTAAAVAADEAQDAQISANSALVSAQAAESARVQTSHYTIDAFEASSRALTDAQDAANSATLAAQSALDADVSADAAANSANHALGSENIATDYGVLTAAWAEWMPSTIPPNILAVQDVTGDHWSSRWWAHRALEIVFAGGQLPDVQAPPAVAVKIDTSLWRFDGIATVFTLTDVLGVTVHPPGPADCTVSLDGIVQEPFTEYTVAGGSITFSDPPPADATGWMVVGIAAGSPGASDPHVDYPENVVLTPTTGQILDVPSVSKVILNPAAPLLTLTLRMPDVDDRRAIRIASRQRIDVLTIVSLGGQSVDWAPNELPAQGLIDLTLVESLDAWVRA